MTDEVKVLDLLITEVRQLIQDREEQETNAQREQVLCDFDHHIFILLLISPRARMAVCDWSLNGHVPFTSTIEPAVLRGRINILPAG